MKLTKTMSFEQFAAQEGASKHMLGDSALCNPAGHIPRRSYQKILEAQKRRDDELLRRRDELRREYDELVVKGVLMPPSANDRLEEVASGEGASAEAARRILIKKASIRARTEEPTDGK